MAVSPERGNAMKLKQPIDDMGVPKPVPDKVTGLGSGLASMNGAKSTPKPPPAQAGVPGLSADGTWAPQNESVSDRVNALTSQDSQLMQLARGSAQKQAAARGLLNSTMAARAGEAAAIGAATPIASQEAAQIAERNTALVTGKNQRDIADANNAAAAALARQQADAQATLETKLQELRGNQSIDLQKLTGQQQEELTAKNRDLEREIAQLNAQSARDLQNLKSDQDLKALQLQTNAALTQQASSNATALISSYNEAVAAIMQNTKLDATSRQNQLISLNNSTQAGIAVVNQALGTDLQWGRNSAAVAPASVTPNLYSYF